MSFVRLSVPEDLRERMHRYRVTDITVSRDRDDRPCGDKVLYRFTGLRVCGGSRQVFLTDNGDFLVYHESNDIDRPNRFKILDIYAMIKKIVRWRMRDKWRNKALRVVFQVADANEIGPDVRRMYSQLCRAVSGGLVDAVELALEE